MLLLASFILTNRFSALLSIINEDSFHPNHLLSLLHPLPPFQFSVSPSVHVPRLEGVTPSQAAVSSAGRHCGTVRPPSFHASQHLRGHMLGDYGRPFKRPVDEIIHALWAMHWQHKRCALSCLLELILWVMFLKLLVEVKPASLKRRLIAVECCCKLMSRVRKW